MSIKHLEQAGDMPDLDPTKKLVLMALADDASKDNRIAYPGMEKLRRWSGRSERRVTELIEDLIRDGHLARRSFAHPGHRAEYIVFPTDTELTELDELDERLNQSRKRAPRRRKPVDNSPGMPATGRAHRNQNARDISQNARDSYRVPPVSTPVGLNTDPVPEVTQETDIHSHGTGPSITPATVSATAGHPLNTADVFAAAGRSLPDTFTDAMLEQLAAEILGRSRSRVIDPTGYVIRALRSRADNGIDRGKWLIRADEIALDHDLTGSRF